MTHAGRWPAVALTGGVLTGALVAFWQARRTWFFGDEWVFLLDQDGSLRRLFEPHNEHWSTLPRLAYRVLVALFGVDHHAAYALMPVLLHAGTCVLLYLLLRRHEVSAWPAVAATLVLAFLCGDLGENLVWAFQVGFLGSAFAGLLAALLVDRLPSFRGVAAGWVAAVACLMCSGMALPMVGFATLLTLLDHGVRRAALFVSVPAAVYLAWYAGFGTSVGGSGRSASVRELADFVHVGTAAIWEQVLRLPGLGGVVLLALVVLACLVPAAPRARRLAVAGAVACLVLYGLLAYSRAGFGSDFALSSRYAYFGVLLTLPAFAVVLDPVVARLPRVPRTALPAVLVAAAAVSGTAQTVSFTDARVTLSPGLADEVAGTAALIEGDEPLLTEAVEPTYNPDLTVGALRAALADGRLQGRDPAPRAVLAAASVLQVAVGPASYGLAAATGIELHHVEGTVPAAGCAGLRAGKDAYLGLATGQELSLTSHRDRLKAQLVSGDRRGPVLEFDTVADTPAYVGSQAAGTLRIDVKPGALVVCVGT